MQPVGREVGAGHDVPVHGDGDLAPVELQPLQQLRLRCAGIGESAVEMRLNSLEAISIRQAIDQQQDPRSLHNSGKMSTGRKSTKFKAPRSPRLRRNQTKEELTRRDSEGRLVY